MTPLDRFFKAPDQSFFLFGPRGTGKSTWLLTQFPDALRLDFLDPSTQMAYSARPDRLLDLIAGNPDNKVIIIDEVQKAPNVLDVVHTIIEKKLGLKFILTGSSSRKLKRTGVDLLGGRALYRTLHPFMAAELKDRFSLESALNHGLVPLVVDSPNPQQSLVGYIALYVREEVQTEGLVRNIGNFHRFLEAVSFSHASLINVSNIARECHVDRKVVDNYLQIIEDLLLSTRLSVFAKRASREVAVHQKLFFFDAGVFRSLRPKGPLDRPEEISGLALEGLVLQHLRAWNAYGRGENEVYFWRTRSGVEVDFIVYGPNTFVAIEVKNKATISSADLKGLKSFKEDYPECQATLLYRGSDRLLIDDILCQPCDAFLRSMVPNQALI